MEQILSRELANGTLKLRIIGHLRDRGLSQTDAEKAVEIVLQDRKALKDFVMSTHSETAAAMRGQLNLYRSMLKPAVRAANISSISNNLDSLGFAKLYEHHKWFLLDVDILLLLGDSGCIFETDGARRFRIFPDAADQIKRIYLPISSTRLLIGSVNNHPPNVEIAGLNKAIARCSFDFFVASRKLDIVDRHFVNNIGKWAGMIGKKELVAILGDVLKEYK
jgi:hypothetical protein